MIHVNFVYQESRKFFHSFIFSCEIKGKLTFAGYSQIEGGKLYSNKASRKNLKIFIIH